MKNKEQKITAVIIDDEPGNIVTLTELLKTYCPEIIIEGKAQDIIAGYDLINDVRPEVVFLDIEMPYGNAFDLLDKLDPVNFEVIFITAFNNYAIKAFKYTALDYILKPVSITELKAAVKKVAKRIEEKNTNTRISSMLANLRPENRLTQKIALPTSQGLYFEEISNITQLEASGSYTYLFINGKKKELVSKKLKDFEDILPEDIFCRIHHSHIINTNFVKNYYKGRGGYVEMQDGTTIEVSVRKKHDFLEKFIH